MEMWRYSHWITPWNSLRLHVAEHVQKPNQVCRIALRKQPPPVFLRARTSDCEMAKTVLIHAGGEYPAFKDYFPEVIIDAGANIGLATVFFKTFYPNATVIAIEPDEENCRMFEMNTRGYANVHLLRGGLWPDADQHLRIKNTSAASYSFQVEPAEQGLKAYTISDICAQFGFTHIDILKVDIEGSERELFARNNTWIDMTDNLFIELHDHYAPGASQTFLRAVGDKGFFLRFSGENVILTRKIQQWVLK